MEPEFDQFADSYSARIEQAVRFAGQDHDFFVRDKLLHLERLFASLRADTRSLKVLDVGCGVGLGHDRLAACVGELHGVDVSPASIEQAQQRHPRSHYQVYDGQRLPFADGSLDCAYAICVMHHVPKPQWLSFLGEMGRVVRPGGRVTVIEHNPFHPGTQWVVRRCELDRDAVLLTPGGLKTLMGRAGLKQVSTRYTLFTPFAHPIFRRLEDYLRWLPLGAQYVMTAVRP